MLYTKFNLEDAQAVWFAEGEAKGIAMGEARGEAKALDRIKSLLGSGLSPEAILEKFMQRN